MTSRWIINLLLLLAIGALSLIAYYEPGIEKEAGPVAITPLGADDITRVHVERQLRASLDLSRQEQGWQVDGQPPLPADDYQVRSLIRLAEQNATRSYAVDDLDLARLQLAPAASSVTLNDTRIEFGTVEPLQGLRYVKVGDRIHLIPDLYQHLLDADYTQFVRRRLFAEGQRIQAIDLPGLSLDKKKGRWTVAGQENVAADRLQQFVERWQEAAALTVRKAEHDAQGDKVTIRLTQPQQTAEFIITSRDPELVLARPELGIQYHLGNRAHDLLELPKESDNNSDAR